MTDVASSFSRAGRLRALVPASALLLGAFAYRGLFQDAPEVPASGAFEQWFFTPERGRALLPIAIALWMLLRRRARLRALPDRTAPALAGALLAAGAGLLAWASWTGVRALLPLSLSANLLAFAAAAKGRAGCRVTLLPALVLLLGSPFPAPLRDGIAWQLQVSSARAAAWLMQVVGVDLVRHGVVIHRGDYAFSVIETCSGLRGIEILTLVALAARELFAASGARSWLVVAAAPCLAWALNVLRIAVVVALFGSGSAAEAAPEGWDHTPQGVALLAAGTALLYLLARAVAGAQRAAEPGAERGGGERSGPESRRVLRAGALSAAALLAVLSSATPFAPAPALPEIELPLERGEWIGEDLPLDRLFVGQFLPGQVLHRRYQMEMGRLPPRIVDLLVGYEDGENPASRLFSPKLLVPGHEWSLEEERPARLWLLGLEGRLGVASRDSELALGYLWRVRDRGLWRETGRSALGLDAGPLRREPPRVVVRLLTPLANDGTVARDRAKRTLDRFIGDFLDELSRL